MGWFLSWHVSLLDSWLLTTWLVTERLWYRSPCTFFFFFFSGGQGWVIVWMASVVTLCLHGWMDGWMDENNHHLFGESGVGVQETGILS
jgi:hypothetical protein